MTLPAYSYSARCVVCTSVITLDRQYQYLDVGLEFYFDFIVEALIGPQGNYTAETKSIASMNVTVESWEYLSIK